MGITTTFVVVVMLLLFSASCSKEHKEVVDVEFDPDKTYTMKATDVSSLISDSGITRYRLKAKEWQIYGKAAEPHWYFPEGIYVEKFDTLFQTEASIKADTAYYYDKKGLWELIGNVEVESLQGEHFETSQLFWDQKQEKVYSDKFMRIEQEDKIITGIGPHSFPGWRSLLSPPISFVSSWIRRNVVYPVRYWVFSIVIQICLSLPCW